MDYFSKLEIYEDFYSSSEPFNSTELGFHIAAALTDYNAKNSSAIIDDPTYGELVFLNKKWDNSLTT